MERYAHSFGLSLALAVLLSAFVYALKAAFPALETWTEHTFGHAWLYMAVLSLIVFVGLGLAGIRLTSSGNALAVMVAGSAVISAVAITGIATVLSAVG